MTRDNNNSGMAAMTINDDNNDGFNSLGGGYVCVYRCKYSNAIVKRTLE